MRDVVASYIGGGWGKDSPDEEYVVPAFVVRGTDFSSIVEGANRTVPARFHKKSNVSKRQLGIDDIVFEVSGGSKNQPVGRTVLAKDSVLAQFDAPVIPASFCKRVVIDKHVAVPAYVYYFLASIYQNRTITQWQTQSTGLSNFGFEKFLDECEVTLPSLPVQSRIAGILSAYDELIENNQRRIRILETMARALYREWFVEFRFPGHDKIPRVASSIGDIPEGWEVKKLAAVAEVNRAKINIRNAPDELHYIDISSVGTGEIRKITTCAFADAPGRARRVVQHGDVLWSCVRPNRRSYAQVIHPEPGTIASTGFAVLTAWAMPFTFLYFASTTDDFVGYLTNHATGAAYPAVTATTFEDADLLMPSAPLLARFGGATIAMAEETHTLQRQIHNLRRTRDLLLPRLLSGQVALTDTAA